jgi:hypothetical protein
VTFKGKNALKVNAIEGSKLAIVKIPNSEFEDGIIEFEMASNRAIDSHPENRGFAGMAFHLSEDNSSFDCIYLRATNGRAETKYNETILYNTSLYQISTFQFYERSSLKNTKPMWMSCLMNG